MIIKMSNNQEVIVDEDDYYKLNKFKWHPDKDGYPKAHTYINNKRTMIFMHRYILNAKKGQIVDHINQNKVDNRKVNLRFCNFSQNVINKGKMTKPSHSKYKGVTKNKNRWQCNIGVNNKHLHLGYYITEEAAAVRYNLAAIQYHGEFANLNNVDMNINPEKFRSNNNRKPIPTRKVYSTIDNIIFNSIKEAAEYYKISYASLRNYLSLSLKNKHGIIYYNESTKCNT